MTVRSRLVLATFFILAILGVACSSDADSSPDREAAASDGADADESAHDGASTEIPPGTVLRVGDQGGILETALSASGQLDDLAYEIEFATFADGTLMNEAFAADAIDIGVMGDTPALLSFASGLDTVVVGVQVSDGLALTLVARPGSGIETLADIEGRRVVFTTGTGQHGFVLRALESVGLEQSDIEQVDVPMTDVVNVLASGQGDAAVLLDLYLTPYLADHPDAAQLVNLRDFVDSYLFLLAVRAAIEDPARAAAIEDLVGRLARSSVWIQENEDAWIEAFYVARWRQTPEFGRMALDARGTSAWIPIGEAPREAQQSQADLFHAAGFLQDPVDVSDQFDPAVTGRFSDAVSEARR